MSRVINRIAKYWFGRGEADFLTPGYMFEPEDEYLIEKGVFVLSKEELHYMRCPFGCGEHEEIHILPKYDEDGDGHFVICSETGEEREVEPREYQLYAFDPNAALALGPSIKAASENDKLDSAQQKSLIAAPNGTSKDNERYMRELAEIILHQHGRELGLHTLLQTTLWIFKEHTIEDPYYKECLTAERIRKSGSKVKTPVVMYEYVRHGKIANPGIRKLIKMEKAKKRRASNLRELSDAAKGI